MRRQTVPIAVTALALAAAGCGSDDSSSDDAAKQATATTAAAQAGTPVPQTLAGAWTRQVTKADIERTQKKRSELGPNQDKPKPDKALIAFEPSVMKTSFASEAGYEVDHDYSATGAGQLELKGYQHPDRGSFCGPEVPQNATYAWKVSGDKLTLRVVKDPCADRDSTFTGTWKRQG